MTSSVWIEAVFWILVVWFVIPEIVADIAEWVHRHRGVARDD